jgi:hypothetical protein
MHAPWAGAATQPGATRYARVLEPCPALAAGHATCFALVRKPVATPAPGKAPSPGARPYVVGAGAASVGPAGGFTPEDLASAYGYDPTASGAGQVVAIVDAYDDPAIESDLGEFDAQYGLPACTTANGCFKKVGQTGTSSLPSADTTGWSVEIALDVETVHAACPNCKILLVESDDPSFANLAAAVNQAVALGATVVSNSYGGAETGTEASERAAYNHPGVPIVASTGDDGYYGWDWVNEGFFGDEMPDTPAALPSVVAVGGTSLDLTPEGARARETVWNNNGPGDSEGSTSEEREGATGGGCSKLFTATPWQHAITGFASTGCGTKRLDADVSAVADPFTGLDIYDSYECGEACEFPRVEGGWVTIGGTSLSAPFISSLYALAGGGNGVSNPALTLYGHAADASLRFDVVSGGNGFCGGEALATCISEWEGKPNELGAGVIDCEGTTACNVVSGFDGPSGIGTPKGLGLFKPLLPTAAISPPGSLTAGSAASFSAGASSDPYPGGSITGASWNWGDGTTGTGMSTSHTYDAPGSYTVTLTVSDAYGLTSASTGATVSVGTSQVAVGSTTTTATTSPPPPPPPPTPNSAFASSAGFNTASGAITLTLSLADPGSLSWLGIFQNGKFGVFAASISKCRKGQVRLGGRCRPAKIAFARGHESVAGAGTVKVVLNPSRSALKALKNALKHKKGVPVTLTLTFQSARGGGPVTHTRTVVVKLKKR